MNKPYSKGKLHRDQNIGSKFGAPILATDRRAICKVLYHMGSEDSEVEGNAERLEACWNLVGDNDPAECVVVRRELLNDAHKALDGLLICGGNINDAHYLHAMEIIERLQEAIHEDK